MKRFAQFTSFALAILLLFGTALARSDDQQKRPPKEKVELKKVDKKLKDELVPSKPKADKGDKAKDRENDKNRDKDKPKDSDKGGDKKKGKGN